MKLYWNARFSGEFQIWGVQPSQTCEIAEGLFKLHDVQKLLVPGSGYGRNSKFFSSLGYQVLGIEVSDVAFDQARVFDQNSQFINASILDVELEENNFDAIYCFNMLHLFLQNHRKDIVDKFHSWLKLGGVVFSVVFSEKEQSFGKGVVVEDNTYESKPGRPTHYFTEEDLKDHFKRFKILDSGLVQEEENHGQLGKHTHNLRYIFAKKDSSDD